MDYKWMLYWLRVTYNRQQYLCYETEKPKANYFFYDM